MLHQNYFSDLINTCRKRNFLLQKIAMDAYNQYPLYRVTLNTSSKQTICITTGIHGTETSGPLGILEFLKKYQPHKNDHKLILLPLLNPYGFFKNKREDRGNFNLNRHFFEKPQPRATAVIHDLLKNIKINFEISLHEDDELPCCYVYKYGNNEKIFKQIIQHVSKKSQICKKNIIYSNQAKDGIIYNPKSDGSLDEWLHAKGIPNTACLEIPDKLKLNKRIDLASSMITFVVSSSFQIK